MDVKRIPVNSKAGVVAYFLVDDEDYDLLSTYRWSFTGTRRGKKRQYVSRGVRGGGRVLVHRQILGFGPGDPQVDHRDGNPLNNQRSNLRPATNAQNSQNQRSVEGSSSRYRGVSRKRGKWQAYGRLDGKMHFLGYFDDEDEAGRIAAEWRSKNMPYAEAR